MQSASDFQQLQRDFAGYLRSGDESLLPAEVSRERAQVYGRLVFNNIKGFLDHNFPVLNEIVGDQRWQQLARSFVTEHACQTPYFLEIGREFLTWLRATQPDALAEFPYAEELAHYEWSELAIAVAEDDPAVQFCAGDLLDTLPQVSANAWPLRYDYPVHQIGPDYLPGEPPSEQTFLLIYRDAEYDVQFMEINALTWLLIDQLRLQEPLTARQLLEQIASSFPQLALQQVVDGGEQTLRELISRGVIIGSHRL
ncbi:MAG: putative DNA-binding domain-containing protein [Gammaproteobacteria bacterium]